MTIYLINPTEPATALLPDGMPDSVLQRFQEAGFQVASHAQYQQVQQRIRVADAKAAQENQDAQETL